jgi:transposase
VRSRWVGGRRGGVRQGGSDGLFQGHGPARRPRLGRFLGPERLATRRQVAAYAGLCPRERTSGSSVRGRSRTGPLGPASLRKALYLPAVVATRANPALRAFAERLRAAGKCPKVVVVAVMRKLLELAWTLLRSGQPFSRSQGPRASTP